APSAYRLAVLAQDNAFDFLSRRRWFGGLPRAAQESGEEQQCQSGYEHMPASHCNALQDGGREKRRAPTTALAFGKSGYQSEPRGTPSRGSQAEAQVVADKSPERNRTLPSQSAAFMPVLWPLWARSVKQAGSPPPAGPFHLGA